MRARIRLWASYLPDGLVMSVILLLALGLVMTLMAAITTIFLRLLPLAGDNEDRIRLVEGVILILGVLLALPLLIPFAYLFHWLRGFVGTRCPRCGRRELEWRSGTWTYGAPPAYQYYSCENCGSNFRQLFGGQGVLSDLEDV